MLFTLSNKLDTLASLSTKETTEEPETGETPREEATGPRKRLRDVSPVSDEDLEDGGLEELGPDKKPQTFAIVFSNEGICLFPTKTGGQLH